jgi:hypothetical protein
VGITVILGGVAYWMYRTYQNDLASDEEEGLRTERDRLADLTRRFVSLNETYSKLVDDNGDVIKGKEAAAIAVTGAMEKIALEIDITEVEF